MTRTRLFPLFAALLLPYLSVAQWIPVEHSPNTSHKRMQVYHDELYVGGGFYQQLHQFSGTPLYGIAKWNGVSWNSLGNGFGIQDTLTWFIDAMLVHDDKLIVAGAFDSIDGVSAANIAAWDGTSFSPLGGGISQGQFALLPVLALAEYNGELYAGGHFTNAGGTPVQNIAKWNGTSWVDPGGLPGLYITQLKVYDGYLYASGAPIDIPDSIHCIARYDGTSWDTTFGKIERQEFLGFVSNTIVMDVYNNKLYVGGSVGKVTWQGDSVDVDHIVSWDGQDWEVVGQGLAGPVMDLDTFQGKLVAGGLGPMSTTPFEAHVVEWDGQNWSALGGACPIDDEHSIGAFQSFQGELFISGTFDTVAGMRSVYMVRYHPFSTDIPASAIGNAASIKVFSDGNNIMLDFSTLEKVDAQVKVVNMLGQTISQARHTSSDVLKMAMPQNGGQVYMVVVANAGTAITNKVWVE